jgi:hypothetical protein
VHERNLLLLVMSFGLKAPEDRLKATPAATSFAVWAVARRILCRGPPGMACGASVAGAARRRRPQANTEQRAGYGTFCFQTAEISRRGRSMATYDRSIII